MTNYSYKVEYDVFTNGKIKRHLYLPKNGYDNVDTYVFDIYDILTEIIDTDGFKEANVVMYIRHSDSKLLETFKENIKTKEELEEFSERLEKFADGLR